MQEDIPEIIIDSLKWLEEKGSIQLIAYVIMPDHLHLLFQLGEKESLQKLMQSFGGFTGKAISKKLEHSRPVWQNTYYDRAIRNEEELYRTITYIQENPVKAGYVEEPGEWPWLYV